MAQPRQDPALRRQHSALHLAFVLRARRTRWHHRRAVVPRELLVRAVDAGLVGVRLADRAAQLIGHQRSGHAADVLERVHVRAHPVAQLLRVRRLREDQTRRRKHRDKQLDRNPLARLARRDPRSLARVVHLQPLACLVRLAQRHLVPPLPAPIAFAEGRVAQARRVLAPSTPGAAAPASSPAVAAPLPSTPGPAPPASSQPPPHRRTAAARAPPRPAPPRPSSPVPRPLARPVVRDTTPVLSPTLAAVWRTP